MTYHFIILLSDLGKKTQRKLFHPVPTWSLFRLLATTVTILFMLISSGTHRLTLHQLVSTLSSYCKINWLEKIKFNYNLKFRLKHWQFHHHWESISNFLSVLLTMVASLTLLMAHQPKSFNWDKFAVSHEHYEHTGRHGTILRENLPLPLENLNEIVCHGNWPPPRE